MRTKEYLFMIIGVLLVYALALPVPILEVDSAQFSVMAMRMARENDFIHLIRGEDPYLDKPHLHFWLAALSYKVFGISAWAYRLPAFLLSILGTWSVFGLGRLLYNKETGYLAALLYLMAQTLVLAHVDVKTDAVLTHFISLALWKLTEYLRTKSLSAVIIGGAALALAFSAKGHLALFIVGVALFCFLLYERDWSAVFHHRMLIGILAFLLTLSPLLYAYYQQFDLHPELSIRGQTGRSGLKFILWEQTFERMSGEGMGKDNPSYFFFYQNLPWVILPFTLLSLAAIAAAIRKQWQIRFRYQKGYEFLTLGGILIIFNIISAAQFKLPHYLNGMMSLFAVITAAFLVQNAAVPGSLRILRVCQYVIAAIGCLLSGLILFFVFPQDRSLPLLAWTILSVLLCIALFRERQPYRGVVVACFATTVIVNTVMHTHFYPKLSAYQRGSTILSWMQKNNIPVSNIRIADKDYIWTLDFLTRSHLPGLSNEDLIAGKGRDAWIILSEEKKKAWLEQGLQIRRMDSIPYFHISRLSGTFLNPASRGQSLRYYYAIQVP